ncbi:MAG: Gfo/Idh/MocA family oxidoreductase [Candidatus Poribacteria bacterium]|nr:Gfo/Idh/MocA family oxidoreductase [Candidatus Poribacteria bacterium]
MNPQDLKAVVVGAGWAGEGHTKALQHCGVEVVAICARRQEIVDKVASNLGIAIASTNWEETLKKVKPDIVALATPAILRAPVIELAVELGAHLLCDKPLANTAKEAEHFYHLVNQANVKHAYAATHCYHPSVTWVNQLLSNQSVGNLKQIDVISSHPKSKELKSWSWMNSLSHGGGMLNNGFPHWLGILERMTNRKLSSVVGQAQRRQERAPVLPNVHDFRKFRDTKISPQDATDMEWRMCDGESSFSALLKLSLPAPQEENFVPVMMRITSGIAESVETNGWYFYGDEGTLIGRGGMLSLSLSKTENSQTSSLAIPEALTNDLPQVGDIIQNMWVALVIDFIADICHQPHQSYLTFRDGWRYQVAIEAIRQGTGWNQIAE